MKKIIILTLFVSAALASGWYYVPSDTKNKMLAFVGAAAIHDTGEIKNMIKNSVLPQNPEEKREVLIRELKKNLKEIKEATSPQTSLNQKLKSAVSVDPKPAPSQKIKELISSSESAIEKLEEANGDKSVTEKITERVLEIIMPSKEKIECLPPAN